MRPLITGVALAGLFLLGSGLTWVAAGGSTAAAIAAGGAVPITISSISLMAFYARRYRLDTQKQYQRFVLTNFLAKVVLIGLWTTLVLLVTDLPTGPFVVSLLANFFVWHVYEAYRYQSALIKLSQGLSS